MLYLQTTKLHYHLASQLKHKYSITETVWSTTTTESCHKCELMRHNNNKILFTFLKRSQNNFTNHVGHNN